MKQRLVQVLDNMKKYNAGVMYQEIFGFDGWWNVFNWRDILYYYIDL